MTSDSQRAERQRTVHSAQRTILARIDGLPDIIGVLPGTSVEEEAPWSQVGLVAEIKGASHLDPMDSASQRANADLVQKYAYVLRILGCFACIYRFDHASAVASCRFNYIDEHQFISKFFYRLLRPFYSHKIVLNGQDDFSFAVSESFVRALGIPELIDEDLISAFSDSSSYPLWFAAVFPGNLGSGRATIYRRPLPEDRCLTQEDSDSTPPSSWRKGKVHSISNTWSLTPHGQAREDDADNSCMSVEHSGAPDPKSSSSSARDDLPDGLLLERVIIQERYPQTERMNEAVHFDKINAYLKKHNLPNYGLAKILYGEDLGDSCSVHVTISATAKDPKNRPQNERSHMRIVLNTVAESLDKFTLTKQFVQAIRDAITGAICWRIYPVFSIETCRLLMNAVPNTTRTSRCSATCTPTGGRTLKAPTDPTTGVTHPQYTPSSSIT
ncbi:hypothetical protein WOLCODRAFT_167874 [Wolfiporia cocos MD-104 SS10]|uniref:Fungal-type protein kinase domain-containing protein n=1 Tax=Wolfiporia cocos (strain MD-104) TaxID=742152 RepID=A0A2H3JAR0_WOLCO|nr:hypothetical protein WOLCODRAFT_167874 [Wolfiporia cocos MD-104 SS10]